MGDRASSCPRDPEPDDRRRVNEYFGAVVKRDMPLGGAGSTAAIEARSSRPRTTLSVRDALAIEGSTRSTSADPRLLGITFAASPTARSRANPTITWLGRLLLVDRSTVDPIATRSRSVCSSAPPAKHEPAIARSLTHTGTSTSPPARPRKRAAQARPPPSTPRSESQAFRRSPASHGRV